MAVFFNNSQRPILSQVVEVLQRLQNDPQQLAIERDNRYNGPPPPYSESGETTQPPTPGPPVVDESYLREKRRLARYQSTPWNQFKSQANRERERLIHQINERRYGRRQTLPWDNSSDLRANSENNIRSRWVEQGIWGDEWGAAWPKDSLPMETRWDTRGDGPFFGSYSRTTSESMPGARWGHEEYASESDSESGSESEPVQEQRPIFGIFGLGVGQPKRPKYQSRLEKYLQRGPGPIPRSVIPRPTVRKPEASRPYHQFLYQISKEREWIKDEQDHNPSGTGLDLHAMAYKSVKDNWIHDEIWNPKWGDLPGMTWIYEEPEEEEEVEGKTVEAPNASAPTAGRSQDTIDYGRPNAYRSQWPNIFGFAPANGRTDSSSTPAPGDAEASDAESRKGETAREAASCQPAVTNSVHGLEAASRRSLRLAKSPQTEQGVPTPPRRSKRSRCSDALEATQPSKRLRGNGRKSVLLHCSPDAAEIEIPHDSGPTITKGAVKLRTSPRDSKVASKKGNKGGKGIKSVSNPIRRSTRIAEREKKQKANMVKELPSGSLRTKTAKKGHLK